ncbi:hypothetical protein Tco_0181815 [Tanacetum coccineum]
MDEPNFNQPDPALSNDDVAAVVAPSVSILKAHNGSLILKQDLETHPDIIDTDMKDASDPNDSEKGVASYENLDGALVDAEMGNTHVVTHELRPHLRMPAGSSASEFDILK